MKQNITVLSGPQGIGKTRHSATLARLLDASAIVDDWNGRDELSPGALAITSGDFVLPAGAVAFQVEDEAGIEALILALQPSVLASGRCVENTHLDGSDQLVNKPRRWPVTCSIGQVGECFEVGGQAQGVELPSHGGNQCA